MIINVQTSKSECEDKMRTLCGTILAAALPMLVPAAFGGVTSDVAVPSESMGKNVPATVILPKGYDADSTSRWPVVYVLHGAGGSHRKYIKVKGVGYAKISLAELS